MKKNNFECFAHENPKSAIYLSYLENPNGPDKAYDLPCVELENIDVLVVMGVGKGDYYKKVLDWLKKKRKRRLVFLEKDLGLIGSLLNTDLGTELIQDRQVHVKMVEQWGACDPTFDWVGWSFYDKKAEVTYDPHSEIDTKLFPQLREAVFYQQAIKKDLVDEYLKFGIVYYRSFYRNIVELPKSYSANALFGKFKNVPAIVCGAGPSLQKNIDALKGLTDKALILAGGSAINALTSHGVLPHFGSGIDPNPLQYKRFLKQKAGQTPYFYRNRLHHLAFKAIKGPKLYLTGGGGYDTPAWFERKLGIDGDEIDEGHNVVNLCLQLAALLGCNPIYIVGVDLAYTNLESYVKGVVEDPKLKQKELETFETQVTELVQRKDIYGKTVWSHWKWVAESEWISEFAKEHPKKIIINATEGGIGFVGIKNQKLADQSFNTSYPLYEEVAKQVQAAGHLPVTDQQIKKTILQLKKSLEASRELLDSLLTEVEEEPTSWPTPLAAVYETELQTEEAFEAILEMFLTVYSFTQQLKFAELHSPKNSLSSKEIHKGELKLHRKKYQFLKGCVLANLVLLKRVGYE